MPTSTRLAGHTLPDEGRIYRDGYRISNGPAVCSCGVESPSFCSDQGRRNWHRDVHKVGILAGGQG